MDFLKASHFFTKKGAVYNRRLSAQVGNLAQKWRFLYIDASALKSLGIFLRKVKTRMISGEIFYALHACIAP